MMMMMIIIIVIIRTTTAGMVAAVIVLTILSSDSDAHMNDVLVRRTGQSKQTQLLIPKPGHVWWTCK